MRQFQAMYVMAEGGGHFPPGPSDFWQPLVHFEIGGTSLAFTRPMAVMLLVLALLSWWLLAATRRASAVPGKAQWLTEKLYFFVRNNIARDIIGTTAFMRFVPFLFALFVFILGNNLMGIFPGVQMPPTARIGVTAAFALLVYVAYHWVGIKAQGGLVGYLKSMVPPNLPLMLVPMLFLLEFITYMVTRPLTLAMRLFGNMFAGHMLLVVFIVGGYELLTSGHVGLAMLALPAWVMGIAMTAFELLIQVLQAYIFTLLAASYLASSLSTEH